MQRTNWTTIALIAMTTGLSHAASQLVLIGTYSQRGSEGIYAAQLDVESGRLSELKALANVKNPSFVAVHPNGKFLYAVSEVGTENGKPAGAVSAFAFDRAAKTLAPLNSELTGGTAPCHLAVDPSGSAVVAANYSSGNAVVLPVDADGRLRPVVTNLQHEGSGPNEGRQKSPHAHGVTFAPDNAHFFVTDLGIDRVVGYRFEPKSRGAVKSDAATAAVPPGAGARHFVFHPNGRFGYAVNELDGTVTAFTWDAAAGALKPLATEPGLPADFKGKNGSAEIAVHPSGRFLYSSNRGHDSITVFTLAEDGRPTPVQHQPCGGRTPRGFGLDPSGRVLVCGLQDTDQLVSFKIDAQSGRLTPAGSELKVPSPVCVVMPP